MAASKKAAAKRASRPPNVVKPVTYHAGRFPPAGLDWSRLVPLVGPANAAIARYDGLLAAIPNAAVLLAPLTTQEAVLSSRNGRRHNRTRPRWGHGLAIPT